MRHFCDSAIGLTGPAAVGSWQHPWPSHRPPATMHSATATTSSAPVALLHHKPWQCRQPLQHHRNPTACARRPNDHSASSPDPSPSSSAADQDASMPQSYMPRPPSSMSGHSERSATSAAEATLQDASFQQRPPQHEHLPRPQDPQLQSQPPKVSNFPTDSSIAAAREAAEGRQSQSHLQAPHLAAHSIEVLRTHPHEFSCSEPGTCGGDILVALDDTDDAAAAVEWVAQNLLNPGVDELWVVHVVCDPQTLQWQTSLGTSPSGRTISLMSLDLGLGGPAPSGSTYGGAEVNLQDYLSRLNANAEQVVAARCWQLSQQGIGYKTELPRLPAARSAAGIAEALLDVVKRHDTKLLVVASHGPGALAEYGSVSRYCFQHSPVPLLLIPSRQAQQEATAAVAHDRAAAAAAAAAAVAGISGSEGYSGALQKLPNSEILLVVNHLEELASVWQWLVDNCAHKGDAVSIWHVAGPSSSGMPSLSTAIVNQMRRRGLSEVSYKQLYSSTGDTQDLGDQVCRLAAIDPSVKLVVMLNYSRRGWIQEALHGSVASYLCRHCPKPLLVLHLPE